MKVAKYQRPSFPSFTGLWNEFFNDNFGFAADSPMVPAVNVKEEEDAFLLEMAVPGRKKEDFKIEVDKHVLTVSTEQEHKDEVKDEDGKYTRREFHYSSFSRSFTLPETVKGDAIEARYDNGVLFLTIPKLEEAKEKGPRLIEIG